MDALEQLRATIPDAVRIAATIYAAAVALAAGEAEAGERGVIEVSAQGA